jgi:hypothetical protein
MPGWAITTLFDGKLSCATSCTPLKDLLILYNGARGNVLFRVTQVPGLQT